MYAKKEMGKVVQQRIEDLKYNKERKKVIRILSHLNLLYDIEKVMEGDYQDIGKGLEEREVPESIRKKIIPSIYI